MPSVSEVEVNSSVEQEAINENADSIKSPEKCKSDKNVPINGNHEEKSNGSESEQKSDECEAVQNLSINESDSDKISNGSSIEKNAEPMPSGSSGVIEDLEQIKEKAENLFAIGKRHFIINDVEAAVNAFQEATELFAQVHGELGIEMGDVYFYYGKSLLEMARMESTVLGNGIKPGDEDGEDEESDEKSEEKDEEMEEDKAEETLNETSDEKAEETLNEKVEENEEDMDAENENDDENKENENDDENKENEQSQNDEDVTTLQLAWEILELSKVVYSKQIEKSEMKLKTAQVHLKLGEVGLENENYQQSIEDFKECLCIQSENLESDDRYLAETYYQLGVVYCLCEEFDSASESFKNAVKVIESRIEKLEKEKKEGSDIEIKELKDLLPEMKEKLVDTSQIKKEKIEFAKKAAAQFARLLSGKVSNENSSNAFGASISGVSKDEKKTEGIKPVSNISHLVKKKRKPEDEESQPVAKKAKIEVKENDSEKSAE